MTAMDNSISDLESWLPLGKVGLVGVCPIFNKERPFSILHRKQLNDKRIVLNVSGRKFETWDHTLKKYPATLLGSRDRESFFDSERNEYFFDADPIFFRHILNYYRHGKLHFSLEECGEIYEDELNFFRIPTDAMGLCCLEEYADASTSGSRSSESENKPPCECVPLRKTFRQKVWYTFENPQSSSSIVKTTLYFSFPEQLWNILTWKLVFSSINLLPESWIYFKLNVNFLCFFLKLF